MDNVAVSVDYWRQLDIVTPDCLPAVTVVGAGGIGSFTLLALAKMGVTDLTVFDDDKVENHNIPNQLYSLKSIGEYKARQAVNTCLEYAGVNALASCIKFDAHKTAGVVISGVDSMASRKDIWSLVKHKPAIKLYIEARMGAEVSRIYTIDPCDPDGVGFYEQFLYDDDHASDEPCTAKAIIYNGFGIAAFIAGQVKKWSKREELCKEIIFDFKTLTLMTQ